MTVARVGDDQVIDAQCGLVTELAIIVGRKGGDACAGRRLNGDRGAGGGGAADEVDPAVDCRSIGGGKHLELMGMGRRRRDKPEGKNEAAGQISH